MSGSAPKKESAPSSHSDTEVTLNFLICFADLTFGNLLGQGAYGKVFADEWEFNTVAIKQYAAQDFSDPLKTSMEYLYGYYGRGTKLIDNYQNFLNLSLILSKVYKTNPPTSEKEFNEAVLQYNQRQSLILKTQNWVKSGTKFFEST